MLVKDKGVISKVRAYIVYSFKGFFKLLGIGFDDYLYLVPSGPEFG